MKTTRALLILLGLVAFAGAVAIQTQAQTFNKKTKITFSQPVAVPGMTLPAGGYTFTILDSFGERNIVQIWNEDKTQLITTILAIPDYRLEAAGKTIIQFRERPAGSPQALKAWFYPGHNYGIEFVYPKQQAVQIAQATNEIVPAETVEPTPSTLKTVPLIAITPQETEEPIATAIQTTPEPVTVAKELPKTASPIPLIGLLGAMCLTVGFGLRRFAVKQR